MLPQYEGEALKTKEQLDKAHWDVRHFHSTVGLGSERAVRNADKEISSSNSVAALWVKCFVFEW